MSLHTDDDQEIFAWRVDARPWQVGQLIPPGTSFQDSLPPDRREKEGILASHLRAKVGRWEVAYAFRDREDALLYWLEYPGSRIYQVAFREAAVAHRGDTDTVNWLYTEEDASHWPDLARQYWDATEPAMVPEILVRGGLRVVGAMDTGPLEGLRASLQAQAYVLDFGPDEVGLLASYGIMALRWEGLWILVPAKHIHLFETSSTGEYKEAT